MRLSNPKDMEGLPIIIRSYQRVQISSCRLSPTMMNRDQQVDTARLHSNARHRSLSIEMKRPESMQIGKTKQGIYHQSVNRFQKKEEVRASTSSKSIIKRRSDKLTRTTEP